MRPRSQIPCSILTKRSEEHTSELQSHLNLVCRLLLEKKYTNLWLQIRTSSWPTERECTAPPYFHLSQSWRHPWQTPRHSNLATAAIHRDESSLINREPKGSCRQQFRAGKANLVTTKCRSSNDHFAGGSPKCALCAAYAAASSSMESSVAVSGSSFTTPENTARSPISVSIKNAGRCVI